MSNISYHLVDPGEQPLYTAFILKHEISGDPTFIKIKRLMTLPPHMFLQGKEFQSPLNNINVLINEMPLALSSLFHTKPIPFRGLLRDTELHLQIMFLS